MWIKDEDGALHGPDYSIVPDRDKGELRLMPRSAKGVVLKHNLDARGLELAIERIEAATASGKLLCEV